MRQKFTSLIEGFCTLSGLKDPERVVNEGAVVVNQIVFSLIYNEKTNPDVLFIYCDFGDVPEGREADAYRALLKVNLLLYNGVGPAFTISFETGRVVFADHCKLEQATPENLRDNLVRLAGKAYEWRATYFLQRDETQEEIALKKIPGWKRQGVST